MEESKDSRILKYYLGELAEYRGYRRTTCALIESLAPYTDTDITDLIAKDINDMIEEHRQKCLFIKEFILVCSESSRDELMKYIDGLKMTVEFLQEDIEGHQQKIEELTKPIPPHETPEETDDKLRMLVHQTNVDLFSKLIPFLLGRVEELRKMLSREECSSLSLLQNICLILKLDDRETISRIEDYFEDKTRGQILSDHGLVIILAISNIVGYSGKYERSMKGNYLDDRWMFDELFVEDPKFGLVSFPSLVYRAFEHPFIQSSLLIEDESARAKLNSSLRCMNNFSRRLNDINEEVLLTMDYSSVSSDGRRMLFADRYFLWVPDIWHVLPTPLE
jgi:hypothetical protein